MRDSRTINTKRNLISGLIKQIQGILMPFIVRTMVLYILGTEYQGLSSLFNSILHMLNLADLGFSLAVVYILYKPIAREDHKAVCAIIAYLKRVYFIIGCVILMVGLVIMPLLPLLISGAYPDGINIYLLYCIYLLNTVLSYWLFAYKSALMTAMERKDLVSNIYTVTTLALKIVQIGILLVSANYYAFILAMPVFTIVNNLLLEVVSRRYFPNIVPQGRISDEDRKELGKQLKGILVNKLGDVARNGCDSIFLSAFLGLTTLAIYDNYYYIYSALYGITLVITQAIQASVGNSIVTETVEKNYRDLRRFTFVFSWFSGWCTICMCCLYQPFMLLWMRQNTQMLFSFGNMLLFCLYFYAITMNNMRNMYVDGAGLFWQLRRWYVVEAAANILLNGILGYFLGVTGIILATIITVFLCNFVVRTNVLFKHYFRMRSRKFYVQHLLHFLVMAASCAVTYLVCSAVALTGWLGLGVKLLICGILPNILFYLAYRRSDMFREGVDLVKTVLKKKVRKKI